MKVLVIGGTLFIGRILVEELVKGGHEVAVLHRKPKHEFGRAYRLTRDPTYIDNRLGTAHNFYLNSLAENGILGGLALSKYYKGHGNDFLVCVTETNTKSQIEKLTEGLKNSC